MNNPKKKAAKILFEKEGSIAWITLNRPEVKNSIDPEMDAQLRKIWAEFRDDSQLRVAVLTGSGDTFSAGADRQAWFESWRGADALRVRRNVREGFGGLTRGLHRIYKPVIAAINGPVLGGSLELVLACDIRIAAERASFGTPLVRYGFHSGDGGISRLANICGAGIALEMQLTGTPLSAARALACNLVSTVVPQQRLQEETRRWAELLLENDQLAMESAKETLFDIIGRPLDEQLRVEALNGYSFTARFDQIMKRFRRR